MKIAEIILALLVPPLAVGLREGSAPLQVALAFLLWIFGWFPGVIYALWLVTADFRDRPGAAGYQPGR